MGNSFRLQPGPTLYGENKTPVTEDVTEFGILFAFLIIAFSFVLIIPGIRGIERLWAVLRVSLALWVGLILVISNFGYGWQRDVVSVDTQYKAFTDEEIRAEVGLHVGLRGVNITLRSVAGYPPMGDLMGETINYNEQFFWADPWAQGRIGFGRFAGRFNREFRDAQYRGMPYPILWVAEYFTLDGEQIRWGRKYRLAGWYTHIGLWLCFAVYLVTLLLFIFVIRTGAIFMTILGTLMIFCCFTFAILLINDPPLRLPWTRAGCHGNNCTVFMEPTFNWSWYLVLLTGILVLALGLLILFLDFFFPRLIAPVFHHSVVADDDIFTAADEEETGGLEYGEASGSVRRGESRRNRRGLTRLRQTQRKSRIGGSVRQPLKDKNEIPLEEIATTEKKEGADL